MVTPPIGSEIAANLFSLSVVAARARLLPIGELLDRAEKLKALGQRGLAAELYKAWIAFNADDNALYAAYFNYAVEFNEASDRPRGNQRPARNAFGSRATSTRPISISGERSKTAARSARR